MAWCLQHHTHLLATQQLKPVAVRLDSKTQKRRLRESLSTLVKVEVVILPKDVGGDDRGEVAAVLFIVHAILHVHEPLCVCVALQSTAQNHTEAH